MFLEHLVAMRSKAVCASAAIGVTVALAGLGAGAASATPLAFTPGSPGLGDPYFPLEGNGGYDVAHYDLQLSYDPPTHQLAGVDTITATATQDLSRFDLDLSNFTVTSVQVNGADATFTRTSHELVITPSSGIVNGDSFTVAVAYNGKPKTVLNSPIVFGQPYGWIYTKDGAFVGCEPNAASTWYPSNDHPSDKATFTFDITVPKGTKAVANGDLSSQRTIGDTSSFVWNETSPMATYLATVDIGRWRFHQTTTPGGIPEFVAVDPSLEKQAEESDTVGKTGAITDYWSQTFGTYAFSSTGAIVDHVPHVGFSLETQTRPLYGFVPDTGTMSHELAHQWFGDTVSVEQWKDIWLNEGFATFASWLWNEHSGGSTTAQIGKQYYDSIAAGDPFWKQSIADPGRDTMFSGAVYDRGGMTLAALRQLIGDDDFFTILRTWVADHAYGNGTTGEFTALASQISGQNLHSFFRTWLWKQAKPPVF